MLRQPQPASPTKRAYNKQKLESPLALANGTGSAKKPSSFARSQGVRTEHGTPRTNAGLLRAALVGFGLLLAPAAKADVSSWLYVGSGPALVGTGDSDLTLVPSLHFDLGLGLPPADSYILGGLVRTRVHIGEGTDVHLLGRFATHGYVNGDWGFAVDAGLFQRTFDGAPTGGALALTLGAPWGLAATLDGAYGTDQAQAYTLTVGIDLLRLTVYRRSGQNWFQNRFPAYRPEDEEERYRR